MTLIWTTISTAIINPLVTTLLQPCQHVLGFKQCMCVVFLLQWSYTYVYIVYSYVHVDV